MTKEAVLGHGRFCKSGFAARFDTDTATCISIGRVSLPTDIESTNRNVAAVTCEMGNGVITKCSYTSVNTSSPLFNLNCECSLKN